MTPEEARAWIDVMRYGFMVFVTTVIPWVFAIYDLALTIYVLRICRPRQEQDDEEIMDTLLFDKGGKR